MSFWRFSIRLTGFLFLIFVQTCFSGWIGLITSVSADESWKNFYGVGWTSGADERIIYAKQMGYDYMALSYGQYDRTRYANNPNRAGLKFYILDPQLLQDMVPVIGRLSVDTTKSYTQEQRDFFERNMVWKSMDPFPRNIETGWHFSDTSFRPNWDYQQQRVIDYVIEQIVALAKSYEDKSIGFTFAGYTVDVPRLSGEFHIWDSRTKTNSYNILPDLTANHTDSGLIHGTITHEYATYTEAKAAFYKQLNARLKREFPDFKWIIEPYRIYTINAKDEWVWQVSPRYDRDALTPDMLLQEASGTYFVDDNNNFTSGMKITRDMVGISQPNDVGEYENRYYAAKAGINWAWYNWFGRFGGTGNMPRFTSITDVYPRLKLIRCVPNWDNLNNVPLIDRLWNGSVYQSTHSYVSSDVIYSRHPKTGQLFAVFITHNGVIRLRAGETVTSVQRTDGYFRESGDGSVDVSIAGGEIRLKSSVTIGVDSSNGQVKGVGYIFTLSSSTSSSGIPNGSIRIDDGAAYSDSAVVTLTLSATDNIGVTGYYLSTSSTAPLATASGWTAIASTASYSARVSYTLSSGDGTKTVYAWYRDAAGNVSNTASDSIVLDTTAPTITITSPTSNSTYTATNNTINLGGNSSDSTSSVSSVTWSNDKGGSGTASGTTSWSISGINLSSGNNVITVTARDGANNARTDTITVSYNGNTSAPNGSISINNGDTYTNSAAVTLTLSATDNVMVTGYYLSTSSTAPLANASGWTAVASTASYSARVSYTLNSGDGNKTVYVWYKDGIGNVSNTASDSIVLDTTDPTITITSPTSNDTYTTSNRTISIGGSASDGRSGIQRVTWRNSRGGSGTASGTTSWTISGISLSTGDNVITVTATDRAGNARSDTITINVR